MHRRHRSRRFFFFFVNKCSKPLMHEIYVNRTKDHLFKKIMIFLYIVTFWQRLVVN